MDVTKMREFLAWFEADRGEFDMNSIFHCLGGKMRTWMGKDDTDKYYPLDKVGEDMGLRPSQTNALFFPHSLLHWDAMMLAIWPAEVDPYTASKSDGVRAVRRAIEMWGGE